MVSRFQCQSGDGNTADSGGFSITLPGFDGFLYFPVGSDFEAYNVITGSFHYQNCRTTLSRPTTPSKQDRPPRTPFQVLTMCLQTEEMKKAREKRA